jgi:hypothetical protein
MDNGPHAHSAWFQGDIKLAATKPIIANGKSRLPQRHNLGMGTGIMGTNSLIVALAYHLAFMHHHRTYGYFTNLRRLSCQLHGLGHEVLVGKGYWAF